MMLLLLLLLTMLPLPAMAQTSAPTQQNVIITHNRIGMNISKPDGSSIDIIGTQPNHQMYFSHDRYGRANGMGFINQPFVDRPLETTSEHNYSKCCSLPELPPDKSFLTREEAA